VASGRSIYTRKGGIAGRGCPEFALKGASMPIEQVEFNTIITFLGVLCATVQGITGYYAAYYRKRAVLPRHYTCSVSLPASTGSSGPSPGMSHPWS
jgi:hypothetical protein